MMVAVFWIFYLREIINEASLKIYLLILLLILTISEKSI